ncbi:aminotransferase class V-fold PLP-dependent enzyme [soil metagenome]
MSTTVDVTAYRREFPLTNDWSYLNHAAHGPFPARTIEAVKQYAESWGSPPDVAGDYSANLVREVKEGVAELAGGRSDNVAFVGSLADGMNLLGNGLDWKEGDNVLIPGHEFPSVVYPFLNLQRKGVEIRFIDQNDQGRTDIGLFEAAMDDNTRAVAISHIEWQDGYRNDLKALGDICRERGIELLVDCTQSLGAHPIDLEETGVTAVAAHGYKWLLSSFGNAVVVFNQGAVERIYPTYVGRLSVTADSEDRNWQLNLRDTAERYQTGGQNILSLTAMRASLSMLREATPAAMTEQTTKLGDYLVEGLDASGYEVISDRSPEHRSQIVTFSSGDHDRNAALVDELNDRKISVSLRGGCVRVSPFFYNTEEDIEQLLEALPPR